MQDDKPKSPVPLKATVRPPVGRGTLTPRLPPKRPIPPAHRALAGIGCTVLLLVVLPVLVAAMAFAAHAGWAYYAP